MRTKLAIVLIGALAAPLTAAEFDPAARAKTIAPLVDGETMIVARVDITLLGGLPAIKRLLTDAGMAADQLSKEFAGALNFLGEFSKAGGTEIYWLFGANDLIIGPPGVVPGFLVVPITAGVSESTLKARFLPSEWGGAKLETARIGDLLVCGHAATITRLQTMKAVQRPELAQAFAAARDSDAQLLLLPTADSRRVIEEIMPTLPEALGGASSTALTRGCLWAGLGVKVSPSAAVGLVIQSADPAAAGSLREVIAQGFKSAAQLPAIQRDLSNWSDVTPLITPVVQGDRLVLSLDSSAFGRLLVALVAPSIKALQQSSDRTSVGSSLNHLSLAMLAYEQKHGKFPARAICDKSGKPLLSWRVAVLPFLDQKNLYAEFRLDEPWDSEHNKKLIDRMPNVFKSPGSSSTNKTRFVVPVGKGAFFESLEPFPLKAIAKDGDGVTNTLMILEARDDQAVIWTTPADLEIDTDHPWAGLQDARPGGFLAVFFGRSVELIKNTVPPQVLLALFTFNGNENIEGARSLEK